jgi:hypothetical protein
VALINDYQGFAGQIVQESGRRFSGLAAGEMTGVIFNAVAEADFPKHFQIKAGSFPDPLGLQELTVGLKPGHAFL